jgi:hypothetical protein
VLAGILAVVSGGVSAAAPLIGGKLGESSGSGVSVAVEAGFAGVIAVLPGSVAVWLIGSASAASGAADRNSATAVEARNRSRRTPDIANSP